MNETTDLDLFLERLYHKASVTRHVGFIELTAYEDEPLSPSVKLKIDEISLGHYIAETGETAQEAFGPSTPPKRAALNLLSVNVDEMVLTRKVGQETLVLTLDGLEWEA